MVFLWGVVWFGLAITIQVPFPFPFTSFLSFPSWVVLYPCGGLTWWPDVLILTHILTCVNYDYSGILSCPYLAGFIWSKDYKFSTLESLYSVFAVHFCSCLDYPCILYFQVSLHSNRWSNITPSSQILSSKLLVSLDLQNFSFCAYNSFASFP